MFARVAKYKTGSVAAFLALGVLVTGCECGSEPQEDFCTAHPEQCVEPEQTCDPDWELVIEPGAGEVTQGTALSIASNLDATDAALDDARIFYELTVTSPSASYDGTAGRYVAPVALDTPGMAVVRARFYCDLVDTFRTAVTLTVVPDGQVQLSPPPGVYRSVVTVEARAFPGDLLLYVDVLGAGVSPPRQAAGVYGFSGVIPANGSPYSVSVTATDAFGNLITTVAGIYTSDPNTPEIVSVSGAIDVDNLAVFTVAYDRDITGTLDPSGSDWFYRVPIGSNFVRMYPKAMLSAGALILSDHLRAFGQGGAFAQRDPLGILSAERRVCACESASLTVLYPDAYEHFLVSPPVTVAVEATVALDPQSLVLTAESVGSTQQIQILGSEILEQNAAGTRFVLDLDRVNLVMGGYYTLTVNADSLHPLDRPLEATVPFSTELPDYVSALDVTAAGGVLVGNHFLQAAPTHAWVWFANNPFVLAPAGDDAYLDATLSVQDVTGASAVVTVPTPYPNQNTNSVYRTLSVWPSNGLVFLQDWSELAFVATYSDRDRSSMSPVSATVTFDDGRVYSAFAFDRAGNAFTMTLPPGFFDYPATMATLDAWISFETYSQGLTAYSVAVTYILDPDQVAAHFVRDSWSWFGMMDTGTSIVDILGAGVSVLYGESVSSVTLETSSPLPATTLVLDSTDPSRWSVAAGASLGPVTAGGVYPATLRMRDTQGALLDKMDVALSVALSRTFTNPVSGTVNPSSEDSYVLAWTGGFDPLYVVGLLYVQLFPSATIDCASPAESALMEMIWPLDAPQAYIPVAGLTPGLYGICASVLAGASYDGAGFTMWQTRLVVEVQ